MLTGPVPANEALRQRYVASLDIIDSPPESDFDDLAALASQICNTPVSLISLIDANRQYFKARIGVEITGSSRDMAICAHAIMQPDLMEIPDLQQDVRFADNPFIASQPNMRFYAGMPLHTSEGYGLGTLCVLDTVPRTLNADQARALRILGRQATNLLKLRHECRHDALTGLANRSYFVEQVNRRIERARRDPDGLFAAMFIDLDRFKIINDSLGHAAGDVLLTTLAQRFRNALRGNDIVARQGGDEFTVLLDVIRRPDSAARVARRLLKAAQQPITYQGHELSCTASIGLAVAGGEHPYDSGSNLLRDADTAMYRAKAEGKNSYTLFDRSMHYAAVLRLKTETDLQNAVDRNEFVLHYQPIVCLKTGMLHGAEALIRWSHDGRTIRPDEFIPIAEDTGLILPIGRWVITTALKQLATWRREHPEVPTFAIAVNLSRKQLCDTELVKCVQTATAEWGISPSDLELEITENTIMNNTNVAWNTLNALHELGVSIAMDDFGVGYSSLSCLHQFPVNILKIDRSFVEDLCKKGDTGAVIQAVVTLAHGLGLRVVAEGLETSQQVEYVRSLNCSYGQGYFFADPSPADQFLCRAFSAPHRDAA